MNLIWPVNGKWKITTDFNEMRPLSLPPEKRWHKHGAIDIGAKIGTPLVAPEEGMLFFYKALRPNNTILWPDGEEPVLLMKEAGSFPFANYFYDLYGSVIMLVGDERIHLFCHSYWNQLFIKYREEYEKYYGHKINWGYHEQAENHRFVIEATYTERPLLAQAGDLIGYVGNAGFSTGPHVHWEIHPSYKNYDYDKRIDPADLFPEQFKAMKGDAN